MDPTAFAALVERCAPGHAAAPLAAIVRQASGFEPLAILVTQNGKPIPIQAPSKEDAIAFAAESGVSGQRVRVGLAGIDTRDLDRLELSLGDAFEPCPNLRAAARLMDQKPRAFGGPPAHITPSRPRNDGAIAPGALPPSARVDEPDRPEDTKPSPRAWDVYGQGRASTALVYAPRQ